MLDRDELARTVQSNCTISDASHAGLFSICGLALRLRDLYKWERQLTPWEEHNAPRVLAWIGDREEEWEQVGAKDYHPLKLNGHTYDPFDTEEINTLLAEDNLFYGAGYAQRLKPTFYLAEIEQTSALKGHPVFLLGHELARDLLTLPAMTQDNGIVVRQEAARFFLWDQMSYIKPSGKAAFKWGLKRCGIADANPETLRAAFNTIFDLQRTTYIYHELGEIADNSFDRMLWREIIGTFPQSPTELLTRAVKDLLADTGPEGPLAHIIQEQNSAGLAFYVAFSDGLLKELFPQIRPAFKAFCESGRWSLIGDAIDQGYAVAQNHAALMSRLYMEGKNKGDFEWAADEIEQRLL